MGEPNDLNLVYEKYPAIHDPYAEPLPTRNESCRAGSKRGFGMYGFVVPALPSDSEISRMKSTMPMSRRASNMINPVARSRLFLPSINLSASVLRDFKCQRRMGVRHNSTATTRNVDKNMATLLQATKEVHQGRQEQLQATKEVHQGRQEHQETPTKLRERAWERGEAGRQKDSKTPYVNRGSKKRATPGLWGRRCRQRLVGETMS